MAGDAGTEIAKAAASTPGGLLLVGGAYSGNLASGFPSVYVQPAGMIATMAMVIGLVVLVAMAISSLIAHIRKT